MTPVKNKKCLHHNIVSQVVKSHTGDGQFENTWEHCTKMNKRIGKKTCLSCSMFNPLINKFEEI